MPHRSTQARIEKVLGYKVDWTKQRILGGVHRRARFRLVSPRVMENLWNKDGGYFVVTAREIIGLMHFGYGLEQIGPWQCMVSKNVVKAHTADLVIYDKIINKRETLAQAA